MSKRTNFQLYINKEDIVEGLSPFKFRPSDGQIEKIQEYIGLLLKWNKSISLTTIVDPTEIVARHFGESIFASTVFPVENCRLADIGTGGGFPGLALKIAFPDLRVFLMEPNKKKCAFLYEVIRALEFNDVEVMASRFDEIRVAPDFANIVTARALGGFSDLLHWSKMALSRRGHVVLWLGSEDSTLVSGEIGWIWQPAVKIPESQRRYILVGRPKRDSE